MIAAIVPAAGQSRRMGRPKLTLPVEGGRVVIARVVSALRFGGAETVVVVAPPVGMPGAAELIQQAKGAGALVVTLDTPTPDMRASVEAGLAFLERSEGEPEGLLICPGDSVGLTPALVSQVVVRMQANPGSIIVPVFDDRRGHPLALPWPIARSIRELPPDVGINALRQQFADRVELLNVSEPGATEDLDTPEDYQRWAPS